MHSQEIFFLDQVLCTELMACSQILSFILNTGELCHVRNILGLLFYILLWDVQSLQPQEETEERLRKKQSVLYSQILETQALHVTEGHMGKHQGGEEEENSERKV